MRKIALIGTHGTGKTTLAHELTAESKKRGIHTEFLGELARECPLPINEKQTKEASEWIIYNQHIREIEFTGKCDVLICDRSVLDGYVYRYNLFGRDPLLEEFVKAKAKEYEYLIKVPVREKRLVADGIRSVNPEFQKEIDRLFNYLLIDLKIPFIEYRNNEQVMDLIANPINAYKE